jgi:hypothetical protein
MAMADEQPITPLTALVINPEGQLTYMGQDGRRYVIVGDAELLQRLMQGEASPGEQA